MTWEDIDDKAKQFVVHFIGQLTEEEAGKAEEFPDPAVELERRKKYDYRKAFRQIRRIRNRRRIGWIGAVACSVALVVGAVGVWQSAEQEKVLSEKVSLAVETGKVVLRLGTGEQVILEDSVQLQEGGRLIQARDGQISYKQQKETAGEKNRYNTLTIPRATEYRVVLADGSVVHLNAESELSYPVSFTGDKREVHLKGEGWFEVAKDSLRPFYVVAEGVNIRVYGTRFNVNTYSLHSVQTVLVEGSIGIQAEGMTQEIRMRPGQLAEYERGQKQMTVKEVDVRQYTAWKDGVFYFDTETLEEIMQVLARWYDLEVIFRSVAAKDERFSGHLERYEDVRKILNTITESTGVIFEINGKTVIIK